MVLALGLATAMPGRVQAEAGDDIFRGTNLLRIAITIAEPDAAQLGLTSPGGREPKPQARATVREGGRTYRSVAVQLKGHSSYQPLEGTPSLTLDFNEHVPGQKFHGLTKISLNNSLQDPTRLHEKLARELFAAAGVPVPRADHAIVTLNGRSLGLYVLLEGYGPGFLKRNFPDASGQFYEGGTLLDLDRGLQFKSGRDRADHSAVERLIGAAREPDASRRWAALTNILDVDRFFSLVAVEAMLCHSDSYSMNRNNYRLYLDPAAQRFVFLPHGMDRILGTHRSESDLPLVPPAMGLVARAVLSTPEGRRRYVARAGSLFTNLFDPVRLGQRVREIEAKIGPSRAAMPGDRQTWGNSSLQPEQDAADLCRRINRRVANLRLQFSQPENLLALTPAAKFDPNGVAALTEWRVRFSPNQPPAEVSVTERDGRPWLRVRSLADVTRATLYCRLLLPAGNYGLAGALAAEAPARTNVPLTILRYHSSDRFTTERHRLGGRPAGFAFTVGATLPEEEIEFVAEVEGPGNEVWVDASGLRLSRGETGPRNRRPRPSVRPAP
jgi:hypothetical protein